jgi:hypothetical protein
MRHLKAAGAFAASLALLATPATGAPVDKGTYHDVFSEPVEDLCGVPGEHDADYQGRYVAVNRGGGLTYYGDSYRNVDVWRNLETGKTFTEVNVGTSRDADVTDNGDGTLTIRIKASGSYRSYDSNGKVFLRDPGQIQFEILVDNGGTPEDPFDDEFLEFLGTVRDSTGRNDLEGRDFCEDFHLVTD